MGMKPFQNTEVKSRREILFKTTANIAVLTGCLPAVGLAVVDDETPRVYTRMGGLLVRTFHLV